jgi:hypothetical protein
MEIVLEYDDTVFTVVSMNTQTIEAAFTQVSPGAIRFIPNITNPAGTLDLFTLSAKKNGSSLVQMYT